MANKNPSAITAAQVKTGEIVDTRTGEVATAGANENLHAESDALDVASLRMLADPTMMAALKKAADMKASDFKTLDKDFWTPGKPGTPEAVLQGIYLGRAKAGRLLQHAIGAQSLDGKRGVIVRVNGTHGLTNALKQCAPRDFVRIEYMGDKTSKGLVSGAAQDFKEWNVTRLAFEQTA